MELKFAKFVRHPNHINIPVNLIPMNDEGMQQFNEIYQYCKQTYNKKIKFTKSGGISFSSPNPAYGIQLTKTCIDLTIVDSKMMRVQFRTEPERKDKKVMSGRYAFKKFTDIAKKYGIDIKSYAIKNGPDVKKTIQAPPIELCYHSFHKLTFHHVHHIDFHSSYAAGLAKAYPEFEPMLVNIYQKRKENEYMKAILNYTIGFMQGSRCKAKYAHLSKAAIEDNNKRVLELSHKIQEAGGIILAYNTDGFWFYGVDNYHDDDEGPNLGQWHYDHRDCDFRAKSAGCYEFIEDGIYHPVVRGKTNLDYIKDRSLWEWGDIYREECNIIKYLFNEEKGIIKVYETSL